MSILASNEKHRILTFENNYGGNTLISLICTGDDELHELFGPNYPYVTYIDPYKKNAAEQLRVEIEKGDIALIWMELVQGGSLDEIPEELLEIIRENKKQYQYYVGVDEILMGFYRLGEITSYVKKSVTPDIITLSKALTYSSFPIAATLVSEEIYEKAFLKNSRLVRNMSSYYSSQFGAFIALNSISKLTDPSQVKMAKRVGDILQTGFKEILNSTDLIVDIKGEGHIYALEYREEWMSYYFCKKAIREGGVFLYIDRVATSLTMTEETALRLIEKLKELYTVKHPMLFKLKGFFVKKWMDIQFAIK